MAGRPKGSRNKRSAALMGATSRAVEAALKMMPKAFKGDAHAFLCVIYKDTAQPLAIRLDAAKAAIPYEKPRLQTMAVIGDMAAPIRHSVTIEYVKPK